MGAISISLCPDRLKSESWLLSAGGLAYKIAAFEVPNTRECRHQQRHQSHTFSVRVTLPLHQLRKPATGRHSCYAWVGIRPCIRPATYQEIPGAYSPNMTRQSVSTCSDMLVTCWLMIDFIHLDSSCTFGRGPAGALEPQ